MFVVIFKKLVPLSWPARGSVTQFSVLQHKSLIIGRSLTSSLESDDTQQRSFVVSYLVNSCGFSPETAVSASRKLNFQNPDRPDSVLALFRNYGLKETHISKLIRVIPALLLASPEKTLLPKLEFFLSIGASRADLAKILNLNPNLLVCSLENRIIPYFNFLKSVVLLNDGNIIQALKRSQRLFLLDVQKNIAPNVAVMREVGMPQSVISLLVSCHTPTVLLNSDRFNKVVREVINMGFSVKETKFIHAMTVFSGNSQLSREHKMNILQEWGWSEDEVQNAFRKYPIFMNASQAKIVTVMDFLVNKMGWPSSAVAKYPLVFNFSLEKRIVPRCSVITILLLKGLMKKHFTIGTILGFSEQQFLNEFVIKYQDDIPELLYVYQGRTDLQKLGYGSEDIHRIREL
ncbi:transcription termination factor MTERF15, mitochondrial-like [Malania oleifera]|uniref:transcription termination factor MTERF15, mitochondrial-like n=1 Tax=Malania oleifera TaxID=397392 RepID=UPI0025AEC2B7|nr:transcription termination factor MTERF15, mitochondrial-like [Malania oleifera]XP_057963734.1 transcription termination factor MTERF15, mitochondrial-like [Malania oleifera]XP_057963735.1 transcription termination factor MTERF15, mitochondrial-like [Malania oleifera]XP_057963737.1 transcription termination factor MTERF15, mitochondrial-like [Malania oleifera]